MITLISGQAGNGKTCLAMQEIKKAVEAGRVVITIGIPKLKLPVVVWSRRQLKKWHEVEQSFVNKIDDDEIDDIEDDFPPLLNTPHGALIVVDEAQKSWKPSGTKEIEDAWALSEHRHWGLDFIIMTQSPAFVNKQVVDNVNKHIHIDKNWRGSKQYEWGEAMTDPTAKVNKDLAFSSRYKPDPKMFELYESSSLHTKMKFRVPPQVFALALLFLSLPFVFYQLKYTLHDKHLEKTPSQDKPGNAVIAQANNAPKNDFQKVAMLFEYEHSCVAYDDLYNEIALPRSQCINLKKTLWRSKPSISSGFQPSPVRQASTPSIVSSSSPVEISTTPVL